MADLDHGRDHSAGHDYDVHRACMERVYIGIAGMIGAGKTTLARALGGALALPVYYEPTEDNEYLADFYSDMTTYAFPMQVYLLNKRFRQQQQIIWDGRGGVQDRTIYEDSVFAATLRDTGALSERDFRTYRDLFNGMANFMRRPNVIVYLDVPPETALERLTMRGRTCEAGVSLEYLTALYASYTDFISDISRVTPVIKVDWSTFRDTDEVVACIVREYTQLGHVRLVDFDSRPGGYTLTPPPSSSSSSRGDSVTQVSDQCQAK